MATMRVGSLVVDLIAESAQYVKELKKANQQTSKFARDVGKAFNSTAMNVAALATGFLSVSAAVDSANRSMENAREIESMARLAGQSAEEFQATAYAVEQYGVSAEKLGDISKDTADKLGDFIATGGGEFKDFFDEVAPLVGLTAKELQHLSGPEVLIQVKKAMDEANIPMKQQIFYLESIANDASLLIPVLENNGRVMKDMEKKYRDMNVALSETDIQVLRDMETSFINAEREARALSDTIWIKLSGAMVTLSNASAEFFKGFRENIEITPTKALELQIANINKQLRASESLVDNLNATVEAGKKANATVSEKMGAIRAQSLLENEIEKVAMLTARLNELQDQLDAITGTKTSTLVIDVNAGTKTKGSEQLDKELDYMSEKMRVFGEDSKNIYNQIDQAAIGWSQSFSQSFTDMIMTGEASFSDFATQVVNDLIRIMIQAQITEPFLRAVTSATQSVGITPPSTNTGTTPAPTTGLATGGPVMKGSTYLVGEQGPELFTASNSGSIKPNNQIGGGAVVNIYTQPGETAETKTRQTENGDIVEVFMKQVDSRLNEQVSRGQGLARTLEGRYSLSRKSY